MITPKDIQSKEFTRGVRGYKEEEVDSYLDQITIDLEKILEENQRLKDQLQAVNKDLEHYRAQEGTVLETLEAAKALMSDISASAEKRAKILLQNAELDAQLMKREAQEAVERLTEESAALRQQYQQFRLRYKSMLEAELEKFDSLSTVDLFEEKDMEDLKNIMEGKMETPEWKKAEVSRETIAVRL
ncbi:MAG: DivIVA domain-containing protein [Clostridiales bacterium]|nr:DivIVA domain-containing protein [Clostridiales bacterium]